MSCRGCSRPFAKSGAGAQAPMFPRLCKDCVIREVAFHGYHAPDTKCLDEYMEAR